MRVMYFAIAVTAWFLWVFLTGRALGLHARRSRWPEPKANAAFALLACVNGVIGGLLAWLAQRW